MAAASFEESLAAHAQAPDALEAARTWLLYGSMLRRAGRRIDARAHLRQGREAFAASERAHWMSLAEAEPRGMLNRVVAAALFLSPKTIEYHLSCIYRKRGLRSRPQLAHALLGRGAALAERSLSSTRDTVVRAGAPGVVAPWGTAGLVMGACGHVDRPPQPVTDRSLEPLGPFLTTRGVTAPPRSRTSERNGKMQTALRRVAVGAASAAMVLGSIAVPAMAEGGSTARGELVPLAAAAGRPEAGISGHAQVVRTGTGADGVGTTHVSVVVSGLQPGVTYGVHLHNAPCSATNPGGGPYSTRSAAPSPRRTRLGRAPRRTTRRRASRRTPTASRVVR